MSEKRTELDELGEFGLIDKLTAPFTTHVSNTIKGVGDDAAVISISDQEVMLVTTDLLLEGVHFNLMYTPLMHLGYKAVMVNLSDIFAMNGTAQQITVSFAVSNRFPLEALEELYAGIKKACDYYKVDLVGGDTSSSLSGLVISISAIGRANKSEVVYRSGAKENDLLVVSGDLGGAYMGLQLLEREKEVFKANPSMQPDLEGNDYLLERQLKPEARQDIIHFLKELEVKPTSMIDVSDGLASEIFHLSKASKLGCTIYDEKIPIDAKTAMAALDFNMDPVTCALNGGEDYELLFTISMEDYDKIKGNPHMTVIGHMTDLNSGINLVDKNGALIPLKAQGWKN
ncbi:MAG: thiamine-phosphate kinase [Crocinitomicaceae bacterium]|nr:MAG: thiamine-phosphate kinase [Crocinitomicaceae bacterium]